MDLSKLRASREERTLAAFPIPVQELCEQYRCLCSGAINDVLREMGLLYQTLPHDILPLWDHMQVAGIAFTVKGSKNLALENELEQRAAMLEAMPEHAVVIWAEACAK